MALLVREGVGGKPGSSTAGSNVCLGMRSAGDVKLSSGQHVVGRS
jgi:hypothetical protein